MVLKDCSLYLVRHLYHVCPSEQWLYFQHALREVNRVNEPDSSDRAGEERNSVPNILPIADSWKLLSESSLPPLNKSVGLGLNRIGPKARRKSGDAKRSGFVEESGSTIASLTRPRAATRICGSCESPVRSARS
jgi:hypothetical protein